MNSLPTANRLLQISAAMAFLVAGSLTAPLFAAIEPAPGTVITEEKIIGDAWIESETTDGVLFYLGDWKSPAKVAVNRKRGQYKSVVYNGNGQDPNFMRAEVLYSNNEFAKAPEFYKKATASAKWNWEIEQSYRRGAACLARTGKEADALATLKEYITKYPKNVHMAEVVSLRAQLGLAAGDHAAAMNDYKEMAKQAANWGPNAELEGHLGQRSVFNSQKKQADSVALLSGYWAKIKIAEDPEAFGQVGLAIAEDLLAQEKPSDAVGVLMKVYLAPVSSEQQCRARLQHAQILAKVNDTENNFAAFDQAAMASILGAEEQTQNAAIKLAREILSRIDKDKKVSDEMRKDYRSYAGSL